MTTQTISFKNDETNVLEKTTIIGLYTLVGLTQIQTFLDPFIIHQSAFGHNSFSYAIAITIVLYFLMLLAIGLLLYISDENEVENENDQSTGYETNVLMTSKNENRTYYTLTVFTEEIHLFFVFLARIRKESQTREEYNKNIRKLIHHFDEELFVSKENALLSPIENCNESLVVIDDESGRVFYLNNSIKQNLLSITNSKVNNEWAHKKSWFKKMTIFWHHPSDNPIMPWQSNPDWSFYEYNAQKASGHLKMVADLIKNGFQFNEEEMQNWCIATQRKVLQQSKSTQYSKKAFDKIELFFKDFQSLKRNIETKELRKIKKEIMIENKNHYFNQYKIIN